MGHFFERLSQRIAQWTGSTPAFLIALTVILAWGLTGPFFHYSETWQLFINTGTTIVTFLMVFLIQRQQNKDSMVLQLKLNELIASHEEASNRLVNAEDLSEEELLVLHRYYTQLVKEALDDGHFLHETHSVKEAAENQERKHRHRHARQSRAPSTSRSGEDHPQSKRKHEV